MLATAGLLIYFLRFASFSTKNIHLTALSYSMFTEACREHTLSCFWATRGTREA